MTARFLGLAALTLFLSGCQVSYLLKSAKGQLALWTSRVSIEEALKDDSLSADEKHKLQIAQKARAFGEQNLGLKKTKNYTNFVKLDRPYVTYVVSAAPAWELKHHQWSFPIVGKVPYKGYFNEDDAKAEESELKAQGLDTYMRGVSAYSTLGWLQDPLLSSMLRAKDHDLINTIIHESVHATLFIKSSADFNERLATFFGNEGAEAYYLAEEGPDSATVKQIRNENHDEKIFAAYMTKELKDLEIWYKAHPEKNEVLKVARIKDIQLRFVSDVQPKLLSDSYKRFPDLSLNNARLMLYKTYIGDLDDFEVVFAKLDRNFSSFLKLSHLLENEKAPEKKLKEWATLSKEDLFRIKDAP